MHENITVILHHASGCAALQVSEADAWVLQGCLDVLYDGGQPPTLSHPGAFKNLLLITVFPACLKSATNTAFPVSHKVI